MITPEGYTKAEIHRLGEGYLRLAHRKNVCRSPCSQTGKADTDVMDLFEHRRLKEPT